MPLTTVGVLRQRLDRGQPVYLFGGLVFVAACTFSELSRGVDPGLSVAAILAQLGQFVLQKRNSAAIVVRHCFGFPRQRRPQCLDDSVGIRILIGVADDPDRLCLRVEADSLFLRRVNGVARLIQLLVANGQVPLRYSQLGFELVAVVGGNAQKDRKRVSDCLCRVVLVLTIIEKLILVGDKRLLLEKIIEGVFNIRVVAVATMFQRDISSVLGNAK